MINIEALRLLGLNIDIKKQEELLFEHLPSYRHSVTRIKDGETVYYIKAYDNTTSFNNEVTAINFLGKFQQDFIVPSIAALDATSLMIAVTGVKGEKLTFSELNEDNVATIGRSLKSFHEAMPANKFFPFDYRTQLRVNNNFITQSGLLPTELIETANDFASHVMQSGLLDREPNCVVHGDFNQSNLLYDSYQGKFGLIDFEKINVGFPNIDLSKISWRLLHNDKFLVSNLLYAYYGRVPSSVEIHDFYCMLGYEYLGAISYYCYEGYKKNYPFYHSAVQGLESLRTDMHSVSF